MGDAEITSADNAGIQTLDELIRRRSEESIQIPLLAYPESKQGLTDYEFFSGKDINRLIDGAVKRLIKEGFTPVGAATAHECHQSRSLKLRAILSRKEYDVPEAELGEHFVRECFDPAKEHERNVCFLHSSGSSGTPKPLTYSNKRILALMGHARDVTHFLTVPIFHGLGLGAFCHCFYKRNTCYIFNGNMPQTHATLTAALTAARPQYVVTVPYALKLLAEGPEGINALKAAEIVTAGGSRIIDEVGDLLVDQDVHLGSNYGSTEVGFLFSSTWRPREDKAWNYLEPRPHVAPYIHWKPYSEGLFECVVLDGFGGKAASNSMDPPNSYHTADLWTPHPELSNRWKFVGRIDDRVTLTNGEKVLPLEIEGRIRKDPLVREAVVFGIDRPVPGLLVSRSDAAKDLSDEDFIEEIWATIQYANRHSEAFSQITREVVVPLPLDAEIPVTDKMSVKRAQVYRDFAEHIKEVYANLDISLGGHLQLNIPELETWIMKTFETSLGVVLENTETDFFSAGVDSLKAIQLRSLITRTLDLGSNAKKLPSMAVSDCGNTARLAKYLYHFRSGEEDDKTESSIEEMQALLNKFPLVQEHVPGPYSQPDRYTVLLTGATGSLGVHILSTLSKIRTVTICCLVRAPDERTGLSRLESALAQYSLPPLPPACTNVLVFPWDMGSGNLPLLSDTKLLFLRTSLTHIIHAAWPVNFSLPLSSFEPHIASLHAFLNLAQSVQTQCPARVLFASSVGVANAASPGTVVPETSPSEGERDLGSWAQPTGYAYSKLVAEQILTRASTSSNARTTILRIGQIVPSTDVVSGSVSDPEPAKKKQKTEASDAEKAKSKLLWNSSEMIPLVIRSAARDVTNALPSNLRGGVDACTWIPVNILARSIVEIAGIASNPENETAFALTTEQMAKEKQTKTSKEELVYNLLNPKLFSWERDFLPVLRRTFINAGMGDEYGDFEEVSWEEWRNRLEDSAERDVSKNPARKLLGFWRGPSIDGDDDAERDASQGRYALRKKRNSDDGDGTDVEKKRGGVIFATEKAERDSKAMRNLRPVVGPECESETNDDTKGKLSGEAYVKELVEAWREAWK
ncbi:MAG: hypothetical protein Q9160_000370 [Pyrenula sp. 1 TL-2023]